MDRDTCPQCLEPCTSLCRCPRGDRSCARGHHWHFCTVHDNLVLGASDHNKSTFCCTCGLGEKGKGSTW